MLAKHVTNTVAVLLCITDSRHGAESNTATRHDCRGYPAHQMLSSMSAALGERGSEGEGDDDTLPYRQAGRSVEAAESTDESRRYTN